MGNRNAFVILFYCVVCVAGFGGTRSFGTEEERN